VAVVGAARVKVLVASFMGSGEQRNRNHS
jgi:hypothetical protein